RVVAPLTERCRAPRAPLVVDDNAVVCRIEETAVVRRAAGARSAMQKQHRYASRVTRLFPIHGMNRVEHEHARAKWLERWIKFGAHGGVNITQAHGRVATVVYNKSWEIFHDNDQAGRLHPEHRRRVTVHFLLPSGRFHQSDERSVSA